MAKKRRSIANAPMIKRDPTRAGDEESFEQSIPKPDLPVTTIPTAPPAAPARPGPVPSERGYKKKGIYFYTDQEDAVEEVIAAWRRQSGEKLSFTTLVRTLTEACIPLLKQLDPPPTTEEELLAALKDHLPE